MDYSFWECLYQKEQWLIPSTVFYMPPVWCYSKSRIIERMFTAGCFSLGTDFVKEVVYVITKEQAVSSAILNCASQMCAAAQSAPKACGRDSILTAVLTGGDLQALSKAMIEIEDSVPDCRPIFKRDAALVAGSGAVVLIGSIRQCRVLVPCGLCGFRDCAEASRSGAHCCYDDIDLGIAIGSAVSIAADMRIDNRVLYTAGVAAMRLRLLGEQVGTVMAIPLSVAPRNQYFFRTS